MSDASFEDEIEKGPIVDETPEETIEPVEDIIDELDRRCAQTPSPTRRGFQ